MALTLPKIVYPTGGGTTLQFVYPPRNVPYSELASTKYVNTASSGVQETIWERTDEFFSLQMEYVKLGTDIANWTAFMIEAIKGITFDYYPDSTLGTLIKCTLEGTNYTAAYKQLGMYTFTIKLRKRVAWP